ncbi:MAG TPA: type I methionyl aminopeptidase [Planctomycetaceae bacterium]|nr:type I methionyl aminopeptidase [Planctomycetaceae bacterium]HIQ22054.1 type I methionyl aminopeptidase [Planctomycetota bacterium]
MKILKSSREIAKMRRAGLLVWKAHQLAARMVRPGVTTGEINEAIEEFLDEHGAVSLFKNYRPGPKLPPFPAVVCTSVNEQIVHGIPGKRKLQAGDVLSLDIGCKLDGWCGDAAATYPVGKVHPEVQRLLEVTQGTLQLAIDMIRRLLDQWRQMREQLGPDQSPPWPRWRQVASAMARYVQRAGFWVVEDFVGHGIGQSMHEDPQVPNFPDRRGPDFALERGLVIAVEPMVNMGTKKVRTLGDRWTQVTADGKPSAHFEHTIAITEAGPYILTAGPDHKSPEEAC